MTVPKISPFQQELLTKLTFLREQKGMKPATVARIAQVSPGTMSDLLKGRKVFSQRLVSLVNERIKVYVDDANTQIIRDLRQFKFVYNTAKNSHKKAMFSLIVGNTGLCKSVALQEYAKQNRNVYYIKVDRRYSWNQLLHAIAAEMGLLEAYGKKREFRRIYTSRLMEMICTWVEEQAEIPCLIIDEAEVLSLSVVRQFKNLYTATQDLMSIVICGITSVKNKIAKMSGLSHDWLPLTEESNEYTTFARRIKRFVVPRISIDDMRTFCEHHGMTNADLIQLAATQWWNYDEASHRMFYIKSQFDPATMNKEEFKLIQSM